jgi:hypothetical protein
MRGRGVRLGGSGGDDWRFEGKDWGEGTEGARPRKGFARMAQRLGWLRGWRRGADRPLSSSGLLLTLPLSCQSALNPARCHINQVLRLQGVSSTGYREKSIKHSISCQSVSLVTFRERMLMIVRHPKSRSVDPALEHARGSVDEPGNTVFAPAMRHWTHQASSTAALYH